MQYDLVIEHGDVILPGAEPQKLNVAVRAGKIAALMGPDEPVDAVRRVDATGLTVFPGVLDVHLHLGHGADIARPRVPEDAAQETAAAAVGGVTTIIPYLMGSEDYAESFASVVATTAAGARVDFSYHPIISTEEQLARVPYYISEFGTPSFKIFMNNRAGEGVRLGLPDIDDGFFYRLASLCAEHGGMVCPHPENIEVVHVLRKKVMGEDPEGKSGLAGWNASRPAFVEADAIQRAGVLAKAAGAPLYVVHTSSAEALEAALRVREAGTDITIETCPHYLTHDITWAGGDVGKINPPLREKADCEALWAGIARGVIDTVATDHVHRHVSAKAGGIWKASPGCPGMETLLPVMLSEGHVKRGIPLSRIVDLLCEKPAKAMGLWGTKGALLPGFDADVAIVDTNASWHVSNENVQSSAGYSIYDGWSLTGKVVHTLVRGTTIVENGVVAESTAGTGRYLKRTLRSGH
jgi:dihydropyrimidinase